ncbi:MAG: GC-type dockerin domain-anchored protein [Phycisphaerales bacterium]
MFTIWSAPWEQVYEDPWVVPELGFAPGTVTYYSHPHGFTGWSFFRQITPTFAPPAPTGVTATIGTRCNDVRIAWSAVSGVTQYQVLRRPQGSGSFGLITTVTSATQYDDTSAVAGTSYDYQVVSVGSCNSDPSTTVQGQRGSVPAISTDPTSVTTQKNQTAAFSTSATGTTLAYQWKRNGTALSNGAQSGIGTVSGATTANLSISSLAQTAGGSYTCTATNICGSATTSSATLIIACGSSDIAGLGTTVGADGQITQDDYILFNTWFFANDPRADIAGLGGNPGPDGQFTQDDVVLFLNGYVAGCP